MLFQTPGEANTSAAEPQGLAAGTPHWFATDVSGTWGFRNFLPRVGAQHRSQGYGYDRGYTSLEAFVPVLQHDFDSLSAVQANWLIDNGGEMGCNVGLLHRRYLEGWDRIVGGNVFYDHRREDGSSFNQVGFGVETLGNYLDWRANGYFPVGDNLFPADGGGITSAVFSGRQVLVTFLANKALTGFDTEVGGIVPGTLDILRGYIGLYHFDGSQSDALTGIQARLEARIQDSLILHAGITNDSTFDTNVVLAVGIYLPGFAPRNTPPGGRVPGRLADPIYRNQNIIIERSPIETPVPARWVDGSLIDVVHVTDEAPNPGACTGAVDDPFDSLAAAQAAASPGSILFVHANSSFTGESVVLQDRQQLLGEGIDHTIVSMYGPFLLPTVTPPEDVLDVPLINSAPGDAVTVANNTVVSGFRIFNAGDEGVSGSNVTDVTLNGLGINNATGNGIRLSSASGDLAVTDSFVLNSGGDGISISTAMAGSNVITINDNTVTGNVGEGIQVATNGDTDNTLFIERNLVRVSLGPTDTRSAALVQVDSFNNSRLSARIEDNTFEDSFFRDDTSPDEDPYFHQFALNAWNNSRVDAGFIANTLESDRRFLFDNPANGSFGIDASSNDLARLRVRFDTNTSDLNYGVAENFISVFQLEDTLDTNTGDFYYFPTAIFFDVIPDGTIDLPESE